MSTLIIRLTIKTMFDGYNSEDRETMHRHEAVPITTEAPLEVDR
jgi:hypothetical protein